MFDIIHTANTHSQPSTNSYTYLVYSIAIEGGSGIALVYINVLVYPLLLLHTTQYFQGSTSYIHIKSKRTYTTHVDYIQITSIVYRAVCNIWCCNILVLSALDVRIMRCDQKIWFDEWQPTELRIGCIGDMIDHAGGLYDMLTADTRRLSYFHTIISY